MAASIRRLYRSFRLSADSMRPGIAQCVDHDASHAVLQSIREVKLPSSFEAAVAKFAAILHSYGIISVVGDCYGDNWVSEQLEKQNITYEESDKNMSDLYHEFLPMRNPGKLKLLDNQTLIQATNRSRTTHRERR